MSPALLSLILSPESNTSSPSGPTPPRLDAEHHGATPSHRCPRPPVGMDCPRCPPAVRHPGRGHGRTGAAVRPAAARAAPLRRGAENRRRDHLRGRAAARPLPQEPVPAAVDRPSQHHPVAHRHRRQRRGGAHPRRLPPAGHQPLRERVGDGAHPGEAARIRPAALRRAHAARPAQAPRQGQPARGRRTAQPRLIRAPALAHRHLPERAAQYHRTQGAGRTGARPPRLRQPEESAEPVPENCRQRRLAAGAGRPEPEAGHAGRPRPGPARTVGDHRRADRSQRPRPGPLR